MPRTKWTGYKRFCPLARGLDVVGERWTLVILHELLGGPQRYTDLIRRLPGIGTSVLADRLRKLDHAKVIERRPGGVGESITYALTEAGDELRPILRALREWGVEHLAHPADSTARFDLAYVEGIEQLPPEEYEWRVGDRICTLSFADGELTQRDGYAGDPALVLRTSDEFMRRWASGAVSWDQGRRDGSVTVEGDEGAWQRMLAATGYARCYEPA